jgi:hypothetical protein
MTFISRSGVVGIEPYLHRVEVICVVLGLFPLAGRGFHTVSTAHKKGEIELATLTLMVVSHQTPV